MAKRKENASGNEPDWVGVKARLDAIVLLLMKSACADNNGKVKLIDAVPLLYSVGYSPTEIAKLVGKNKATEITTYLYQKKK